MGELRLAQGGHDCVVRRIRAEGGSASRRTSAVPSIGSGSGNW